MSRTDSHVPHWVKVLRFFQDNPYTMEIIHTCHRRSVECDFDPNNVAFRWQAGYYKHCYVDFTYYGMNKHKIYYYGGHGVGRRINNRKDRRRTNMKTKIASRTPVEELDDFFVYDHYPDSTWWW